MLERADVERGIRKGESGKQVLNRQGEVGQVRSGQIKTVRAIRGSHFMVSYDITDLGKSISKENEERGQLSLKGKTVQQ